ncbi:hypothetical protein CIK06_18800 [Plantactinospora sp. KBS50]|nr:hypothetical protein CIK06_18800 [Plantactinospora sp. KBS50]
MVPDLVRHDRQPPRPRVDDGGSATSGIGRASRAVRSSGSVRRTSGGGLLRGIARGMKDASRYGRGDAVISTSAARNGWAQQLQTTSSAARSASPCAPSRCSHLSAKYLQYWCSRYVRRSLTRHWA